MTEPLKLEQSVILSRDARGFGFEVTGDKPAYIFRIQKGSVAEQCGLRVGDELLRINGDLVSQWSAERVNSVLKKAGKHLQLTVRRNQETVVQTEAATTQVSKHKEMNRTRLSIDAAFHDSLSSIKRSIFSQKVKSSGGLTLSASVPEDNAASNTKSKSRKASKSDNLKVSAEPKVHVAPVAEESAQMVVPELRVPQVAEAAETEAEAAETAERSLESKDQSASDDSLPSRRLLSLSSDDLLSQDDATDAAKRVSLSHEDVRYHGNASESRESNEQESRSRGIVASQSVRLRGKHEFESSRPLAQRSSLRNELRYRVHSRRNSAEVAHTSSSMMTPALLSLEEESEQRERKQDPNANSAGFARLFRKSEKRRTTLVLDVKGPSSISASFGFSSHFEAPLETEQQFVLPALDTLTHRAVYESMNVQELEAQKVLVELLHTERLHAHYLRVVDTVFYADWPAQSNELREMLIAGLPQLVSAHSQLLQQLLHCSLFLEDSQFAAFDVRRVAQVLHRTLSDTVFSEQVARFCERQNEAFAKLNDARLNDRRFAAFVQHAEANPACRRMRLNDLALIEMQRVTKYPLLIDKLVHCCDKAQRDNSGICEFESKFQLQPASCAASANQTNSGGQLKSIAETLQDAFCASRKLLDLVNARVREYENRMRWRSLVAQVDRVTFSDVCQSYLENRRVRNRWNRNSAYRKTSSQNSKVNLRSNNENDSVEKNETSLIDSLRRSLDAVRLVHSSDRLVWQLGHQRQLTTIATLIQHEDSLSRASFFLLLFEPISAMQTAQVSVPAQKLVLHAHSVALSGSSSGASKGAAYTPPLLLPLIRIDERTLVRPDAADKRAFFVVSNTQTQIHSFLAPSAEERRVWLAYFDSCIAACGQTPSATSTLFNVALETKADNQNDIEVTNGSDKTAVTVDGNLMMQQAGSNAFADEATLTLLNTELPGKSTDETDFSPSSQTELLVSDVAQADSCKTSDETTEKSLTEAQLELITSLAAQNELIECALERKSRLLDRLLDANDASAEADDGAQCESETTETEVEELKRYIRSLSAYSDSLIRSFTTLTERQLQTSSSQSQFIDEQANDVALLDRAALAGVHQVLRSFVDRYRTEV